VALSLAVLATTADRAASRLAFGTKQLRFEVDNSSRTNWGCLVGLHVASDPHPTPNGVLRAAGGATPIGGATQVWRLTATACNASFPAATLALDSCTASCARKYVVHGGAQADPGSTRTHLRWEQCDTPGLVNSAGRPASLDIDVVVDVFAGGRSVWSGTVGKGNAGGLCLQSFALPSLESLRFTAAARGKTTIGSVSSTASPCR
jgi:hypothetical protein